MKPGARRSTIDSSEDKICVMNAEILTEVQLHSISKLSLKDVDDDISTQSGTSSPSSRRSSKSSDASSVEELPSHSQLIPLLPGAIDDISMSCTEPRKSELDEMAALIAESAQKKFSGRVYQDVRNAFLAVDANGDGKLNRTEAVAFCQHFDLSSEVASRFFTLVDRDETGLANWSSFLAKYAPVFNKKDDHRFNAGVNRKWPALQ